MLARWCTRVFDTAPLLKPLGNEPAVFLCIGAPLQCKRAESTKFHYLRHVRLFQDYYNKPADEMGEAEISNHRILSVQDGDVSFKWRDYRDGSKEKVMTLSTGEFMRCFLLHVLPPGFTKIRHYGFLASAAKKKKLTLCKKLTGAKLRPVVLLSAVELMQKITGRDITLCQVCGIGHFSPVSGLSPPTQA